MDLDIWWAGHDSPTAATSAALVALGRALRSARWDRGWSQRDLEARASVDQTVISRLENGLPVGLRLNTFIRLMGALEVDTVVLVRRSRSPGGRQ